MQSLSAPRPRLASLTTLATWIGTPPSKPEIALTLSYRPAILRHPSRRSRAKE